MNKKMKYYEVTFDTKKGSYQSWLIHIAASNLQEARSIAESEWNRYHDAHMFHIETRLLRDEEPSIWDFSKVKSW